MIDYHLYRKNTINETEVQFRFSAGPNLVYIVPHSLV